MQSIYLYRVRIAAGDGEHKVLDLVAHDMPSVLGMIARYDANAAVIDVGRITSIDAFDRAVLNQLIQALEPAS